MQLLSLGGTRRLRCAYMDYGVLGRGSRGGARNGLEKLCDTEMGAMKAEGHARVELPINLGYKSVGYCMHGTEKRAQGAGSGGFVAGFAPKEYNKGA